MGLKKIGGLWQRASKQNKQYLAGSIDLGALGESKIMVFKNEKKKDKQPDYTISLVTPDDEKADN